MGHLAPLFLILPAVGLLPAAKVLLDRFRSIHERGYVGVVDTTTGTPQPWTSQMLVLLTLSITPVMFGLVLFFIAAPSDPTGGPITDAMAVGFGTAGFGVAAAPALIYWRGVPWLLGSPESYGKLVVLAAMLQTNVIFAMVIAFQVLALIPYTGTPVDPSIVSRSESLAMPLGLFGVVPFLQALVIVKAPGNTYPTWFLAGVIRSAGTEVLALLLLVWMFLQLEGL